MSEQRHGRFKHHTACHCITCRGWGHSNPDNLDEHSCRCVTCTQARWTDAWDAVFTAKPDTDATDYLDLVKNEHWRHAEHLSALARDRNPDEGHGPLACAQCQGNGTVDVDGRIRPCLTCMGSGLERE